MSMQYPIIIDNEPELCRFIRDIFKEAVKDHAADLPVLMSQRRCYQFDGISQSMVREAIKRGELKLSHMGGKVGIKRKDFLDWINRPTKF